MAVAAWWLTITRGGVSADATAVRSAVWIAAITTAAQAGHFAEELTTGLQEHLPAALGNRACDKQLTTLLPLALYRSQDSVASLSRLPFPLMISKASISPELLQSSRLVDQPRPVPLVLITP